MLKKYFKYILPAVFLELLCASIVIVGEAVSPIFLSYIIDNFSVITKQKILKLILVYILSIIVVIICNYGKHIAMILCENKLKYKLRNDLFRTIISMDYINFHKHTADYYVSTMITDIDRFYASYYSALIAMLLHICTALVLFILLCIKSPIMAFLMILSSFPVLISPLMVGKKYEEKELNVSNTNASYLSRLNELFSVHDIFNKKTIPHIENVYNTTHKEKVKAFWTWGTYDSFTQLVKSFSLYGQQVIIFCLGLALLYNNIISIGTLSASIIFTNMLNIHICNITYDCLEIKTAKAYKNKIQDIFNILDLKLLNSNHINELKSIELSNINLKVSDKFELSNIFLKLENKEKYAIVGLNGSGKTTLMKVCMGFLKADSGIIKYQDFLLNDINPGDYISYIPSARLIIEGTVLENITMFDGSFVLDERMNVYVEKLGLKDLLNRQLERNGSDLSGGQKAKICTLRGLYSNKDFIFLDEPLNAVDEKSCKEIQNFLTQLDKTVVEITHDVSLENLKKFDNVIVMSNGKIKDIIRTKDSLEKLFILSML